MARNERSAGVILYRDDAKFNQRLYLLLDYGRHWDYPKGHVEKGESDEVAALRELGEETGIHDSIIVPGFAHEISYFFRDKKKGLIRKSVVFFLAHAQNGRVTLSHEHVGFEFLPYDQAIRRLNYPTAKQVLEKAHAFVAESHSKPD